MPRNQIRSWYTTGEDEASGGGLLASVGAGAGLRRKPMARPAHPQEGVVQGAAGNAEGTANRRFAQALLERGRRKALERAIVAVSMTNSFLMR